MRVAPPGTTILKQGTGSMAGKQIITVHKGGAVANQPQIVTLVKTTQGMAVATVSSGFVCVSCASMLEIIAYSHTWLGFLLTVYSGFVCVLCKNVGNYSLFTYLGGFFFTLKSE